MLQYVEWRVGLRSQPPFVYFADQIRQIRPNSSILTNDDERSELRSEKRNP